MKTKTLLLWKRKGARIWKVVGTATAECSALHIHDMSLNAERGNGKVAIVDAEHATHARSILRIFEETLKANPEKIRIPWSVDLGGRRICVGPKACDALEGAIEALQEWDARIARRGRVTSRESRALPPARKEKP